ncbi:DUF1853 family protein [Mangrovimonas xylaniphaga]|uniref:DUF1853 family protein n=1 Tax=Mangrovimonas xylaniphaga TaxID=1645915 RepID=UPI0006B66A6D|nr:DUF1853 family protein [Mangrovimonas xylaniphaga]
MDYKKLKLRYIGYYETPILWKGDTIYGLRQLELQKLPLQPFNEDIKGHLRLGKLAEQFVSHSFKAHQNIQVIASGIQIQKNQRTLGELDAIITLDDTPIHLEIIYKFYLYDEQTGTNEIEHWIGPNKKDSLIQKLEKLKNKQLPLLHQPESQNFLKQLSIEPELMEQRVLFKAQLFVPWNKEHIEFSKINQDCIQGFYIKEKELPHFKDCKCYMPPKLDWFIIPHPEVDWQTYTAIEPLLLNLLNQQTSPLVWVKHPNGMISKCFLVWW